MTSLIKKIDKFLNGEKQKVKFIAYNYAEDVLVVEDMSGQRWTRSITLDAFGFFDCPNFETYLGGIFSPWSPV